MFNQYILPFRLKLTAAIFLSCSFSLFAADQNNPFVIDFPTCDLLISADETTFDTSGVTFSGNVTVLVGFANLKADKVKLIKNKDGGCQLISTD